MRIILVAIVLLRAAGNEVVFCAREFQRDTSTFILVQHQQIPTSGVTVLQTVTSRSAVSCSNTCDQYNQQQTCDGFISQSTVCETTTSSGVSSVKSGTCTLLNIANSSLVSFEQSENDCQRFYARSFVQLTLPGLRPLLISTNSNCAIRGLRH